MKIRPITVGARATGGALSALVPDLVAVESSRVCDVSLVMKGEEVPASAHWEGVPAVRVLVPGRARNKAHLPPWQVVHAPQDKGAQRESGWRFGTDMN